MVTKRQPKHELGLPKGALVTRHKVHRRKVRLMNGRTIGLVFHETWTRNLLRIPDCVTDRHLRELGRAGLELATDIFGNPIAKAPGAPWFNGADFEIARWRFILRQKLRRRR
ncbi:uncharacterized protein SOCE26_073920 [Sorangium cellulosum]|uniref:Uncharacterized protein n=1 Tax=Sorangium cellulosum TaxID=56 RepID=A0A2L0F2V5_SORCE|nr:hypothetical protein [Sorangium cellulosum]AUX45892.1 uncharacterized protein SOCE26_073920 [Sorangium cellulosum]